MIVQRRIQLSEVIDTTSEMNNQASLSFSAVGDEIMQGQHQYGKVCDSKTTEESNERNRLFVCEVCFKEYTSRSRLQIHIRTHVSKNIFSRLTPNCPINFLSSFRTKIFYS